MYILIDTANVGERNVRKKEAEERSMVRATKMKLPQMLQDPRRKVQFSRHHNSSRCSFSIFVQYGVAFVPQVHTDTSA